MMDISSFHFFEIKECFFCNVNLAPKKDSTAVRVAAVDDDTYEVYVFSACTACAQKEKIEIYNLLECSKLLLRITDVCEMFDPKCKRSKHK